MSENITYTEEEKRQFSERSRARMKEITDSIETGIMELFESEKYKQYLTVMSRFHRYSVNNTMLIYMQDPQATYVAGYEKWKKDFGRQVRGGAKAIKIIAPTPITKTVEKMKWDDEHNRPFFDEDGQPIMEEREVRIPRFKVVSVFDVRQTRGRPLPQLASELSGNVEQYELFLEALKRTSPVPIRFDHLSGDMDGYYSRDDKEIVLREGMSEAQTICAAIHELGHAKLHDYERLAAEKGQEVQPKDRRTEEVEAESISYSVCKYYGIDTGENSFGYIAGWSQGKELKELKASLETINRTANHLIYNIDKNFREIAKERGVDLLPEKERDSMEDFAADLCEYREAMYQNGAIARPFGSMSKEDMSKEAAKLLRLGDFDMARRALRETAEESGQESPAELVERLEALSDQWDAGLIYQLEPALEDGRSLILASHPTEGEPVSQGVIFSGPTERCQKLLEQLENGEITARAVRELSRQQELAEQLPERSQLLLVNGGKTYLHVQATEGGYDYTLYDAASMKQQDGGVYEDGSIPLSSAYLPICAMHDLESDSAASVPYSMLEKLEQANEAPALLDAYPMPDSTMRMDDLRATGFSEDGLLPVSREKAKELFENGFTVYSAFEGAASMCMDPEDLDRFAGQGIFAVAQEEWEESPEFDARVQERLSHQEEREAAFAEYPGDAYAIYQMKMDRDGKFRGLDEQADGVHWADYDLIYTHAGLPEGGTKERLDNLWVDFNQQKPVDFHAPSMSVSDIVALKQDGKVSYHYCDSIGFQELPGFNQPENYLKSAEMSQEDDYGMIDGIINNGPRQPTVADLEEQVKAGQSISLLELAEATHREEKKPSVLQKLREKAASQKQNQTAPERGAKEEVL